MTLADQFFHWAQASYPQAYATLRPPATGDFADRIRASSGCDLPPTLVAMWRRHDGQADSVHATLFFGGMVWLSADAAFDERKVMQAVLEDLGRKEEWPPSYLPFAGDGSGGFLIVDLSLGSVFEYHCDGDGREAEHGSTFDEFLEKYLARFSNGELRIDKAQGVVDSSSARPMKAEQRPPPTNWVAAIVLAIVGAIVFVAWLSTR